MLARMHTPIGPLCLETDCGVLERLYLPQEAPDAPPPVPGSPEEAYFAQIYEYLLGRRRSFDIPTRLPCHFSPIRCLILQRIAAIPYGNTATYGQLGAPRAVGQVCASNPLPLIIPCHRVLPVQNAPGHYRGGSDLKRFLLQLEKKKKELPQS